MAIAPRESILDLRAHIETPENVQLSFRLAGPGTRLGAYLIDFALRIVILIALGVFISLIAPFLLGAGLSMGIFLISMFVLEWCYGCIFEGLWSGRTPGKWLLGLRVLKVGGYPINFYDAVLRNLLRAADALPIFYGTALFVMSANSRMQRLGDLLAGTIVVREQRERLRGTLPILNTVPIIPRSQRNTGYRPSDRALELIERFFLRRDAVSANRAEEIARVLAHPIAVRMALPVDSHEVVREPSRFLLRVLRTYLQSDESTDGPAANPAGAEPPAVPVLLTKGIYDQGAVR